MAAELTDSKPLAPCPFCGGEAMRRARFHAPLPIEAGCPACKVWTDVAIWNHRTDAPFRADYADEHGETDHENA
jgi:hypothetical protein